MLDLGTRPEAIRIAPVVRALSVDGRHAALFVLTGSLKLPCH